MNIQETAPKKFSRIRKWATPLTMGTFLLTAGTGLGLFFEVEWGLVKPIHEWLSLTLVAGGLLHVWDHRNSVLKHLSGTWGKAFLAGGAAILIASLIPFGGAKETHLSSRDLGETLERIPLAQLAQARDLPVDSLVARLSAAGVPNASPTSTLAQLTAGDRHLRMQALAAVVSGPQKEDDDD